MIIFNRSNSNNQFIKAQNQLQIAAAVSSWATEQLAPEIQAKKHVPHVQPQQSIPQMTSPANLQRLSSATLQRPLHQHHHLHHFQQQPFQQRQKTNFKEDHQRSQSNKLALHFCSNFNKSKFWHNQLFSTFLIMFFNKGKEQVKRYFWQNLYFWPKSQPPPNVGITSEKVTSSETAHSGTYEFQIQFCKEGSGSFQTCLE